MDADKLRAAIGPRADVYLKRFERMERAGGGWVPGWNWPAFFCSTAWFTYRRLDGWAIANFFLVLGGAIATIAVPSQIVFFAYLLTVFLLVPIYANAIYFRSLNLRVAKAAVAKNESAASRLLRAPSAWTLGSAVVASVLAFLFPAVVVISPAYSDYGPRSRVSEGLSMARSLRAEIEQFYASNRRLPGAQEALQLRSDRKMKFTHSVVYDVERKMIVVTMGDGSLAGKRFAMHATEKNGSLEWSCRTIDLEKRYLPGACRD